MSGWHACPPAATLSRSTAPASAADAKRRLGVECSAQQRVEQLFVDRALARDHVADGAIGGRPEQPCQRKILCRRRAGDARGRIEYPPRQAAVIDADGPATVGGEIDHREGRRAWTLQFFTRADAAHKLHGRPIARQHQVIAVVDSHAERGIVVAAATPAGLVGGLVQHDLRAGFAQPHGGGESGEPGADDVDLDFGILFSRMSFIGKPKNLRDMR